MSLWAAIASEFLPNSFEKQRQDWRQFEGWVQRKNQMAIMLMIFEITISSECKAL